MKKYDVKPVELFIKVPRQKQDEDKKMAKKPNAENTETKPKRTRKPRKPKVVEQQPVVITSTMEYPEVEPVKPFITLKAASSPSEVDFKNVKRAGLVALIIIGLLGAWQFKDKIDNFIQVHYVKKLVDDITTPAGTETDTIAELPSEVVPTLPPQEEVQVVEPEVSPSNLAKIIEMRKFYLSAYRVDGKIELRTGGNPSWRFNNPSRLIHGDFTRMMGAIGSDGQTAVFPSYELGRKAAEAYLFTEAYNYSDKTFGDAFKDYAVDDLVRKVGVDKSTKLSDLTTDQRSKLLDAIQEVEGWIEGKVTIFEDEEDFKKNGW